MSNGTANCPFCQPDGILFENELAYVHPSRQS